LLVARESNITLGFLSLSYYHRRYIITLQMCCCNSKMLRNNTSSNSNRDLPSKQKAHQCLFSSIAISTVATDHVPSTQKLI
jgi:hypothetical protein